jgi:hypothetical protein
LPEWPAYQSGCRTVDHLAFFCDWGEYASLLHHYLLLYMLSYCTRTNPLASTLDRYPSFFHVLEHTGHLGRYLSLTDTTEYSFIMFFWQ